NALASRFVPLEVCWPDREVFDIEGTRRLEPSELPLARALQGEICDDVELTVRTKANKTAMLRVNARPMLQIARGTLWAVAVFQDIGEEIDAARHQRELERQLAQAQKMESLGQLASGIAHEINTPTQYISDNVRFLSDAFEAMARYQGEVAAVVADGAVEAEAAERLDGAREDAELEFYAEEVPAAIRQSLEGLDRVASIVRAMKEYAHPCDTKEPTDLDHVVKTTVAMSKNEYKYVADLELELAGDLPKVACVAGEISQVLLNLVVNAAHAIAEAGRERGVIRIRTSAVDDGVQLEVTDNGVGVPEHLSERIFDPFFTTKAVGKGTGQGLALAFDVVVRKHGGRLDVRSTQGEGSTFTVFVPRNAREAPAA
ncbi:MAG: hypothetical protein KC656_33065, partial [Myxococcales bacterium]|nr:hypothetical protein [Myxococcales bacterium]